jgi:glyoxylase-like metal-dependent hydrolase (beta-lactamase superfamily II)
MSRRLYSIRGNDQKLDGGAMFGNAPKALWERWSPPDEQNRIELATRAMLVHEGDRFILFEAGIGAFLSPRMRQRYGVQDDNNRLLDSLDLHGLSHADVHVVVMSHLHFDHAGGLLSDWSEDGSPRLLFPNATFLVSARHWQRANQPHDRDRASFIPELNQQLSTSGRLALVDGPTHPLLGPGYHFHFSDGHTPGMMLTELDGDHGPVVFAADLVPGRAWVHTSISMGYDRFPELLLDEKRALLTSLAKRHGRLFYTHDPATALSHITRDAQGRFGSANNKASVRGLEV